MLTINFTKKQKITRNIRGVQTRFVVVVVYFVLQYFVQTHIIFVPNMHTILKFSVKETLRYEEYKELSVFLLFNPIKYASPYSTPFCIHYVLIYDFTTAFLFSSHFLFNIFLCSYIFSYTSILRRRAKNHFKECTCTLFKNIFFLFVIVTQIVDCTGWKGKKFHIQFLNHCLPTYTVVRQIRKITKLDALQQ